MAKVQKLLDEGIEITRTDFYVVDVGEPTEYYIDPMTESLYNEKNQLVGHQVKPIAEHDTFFYYICGMCQQIHIDSKRMLTVDNRIHITKCDYISTPVLYSVLKDTVAHEDVEEPTLEKEWNQMQDFEK